MMLVILKKIDQLLVFSFRLHDVLSNILAKHFFLTKRGILVVAHLSLFGFFFPEWRKDFGVLAASILIAILFLSPLSRLFRMRLLVQLMGLRREFGILMGYLAAVHALGYFLDPRFFVGFVEPYWQTDFFAINPAFLSGMLAFLLTLPLLLTSNDLALRYLGGKKWKNLHRMVYLLFAAAIAHRFLIRTGGEPEMENLVQAVFLVGSYIFVKLLAWKNFIPSLENGSMYVARRYREYTTRDVPTTGIHL